MKNLTRLFLLCLMMIASPLQGIAASAMFCCCPEKHPSMATHENDEHLDHHSSIEQSHQSDTTHADHFSTMDKCSSCADCCAGCMPATTSSDQATCSPSQEKIDLIFSSHTGHISDGIERPPRN